MRTMDRQATDVGRSEEWITEGRLDEARDW